MPYYWNEHLTKENVTARAIETRFGERTLPFSDPHEQSLALVETSDPRESRTWDQSPVPDEHQIRGLHSARVWERELKPTAEFLTNVMGFTSLGEDQGWHRFGADGGGSGNVLDVREVPEERRGGWGVGSVHHIAWRVADDAAQRTARMAVAKAGRRPTEVIDRFWFRSVYFLEPGGVLFELATDGPGFTIDESAAKLGEQLILPPWLEPPPREAASALS